MNGSSLSVIVPAFGGDPSLGGCLESLACQTLGEDRFEVVIVENGPVARPLTPPKALDVRQFGSDPPGSYRARNRGIELARHELIAFLDADCVAEPGWLEAGLEALNEGWDIVAGRIDLTYLDQERPTAAEVYERLTAFRQDRNVRKGFSVTANMFTRRAVFARTGFFREDLLSGGDVEWGRRAVASGARITFCGDAGVRHPARRTVWELAGKVRRVTGGVFGRHRLDATRARAATRTVWTSCQQTAGFLRHVARLPPTEIGMVDRARAIVVRLCLQVVALFEVSRLMLGAPPRNR